MGNNTPTLDDDLFPLPISDGGRFFVYIVLEASIPDALVAVNSGRAESFLPAGDESIHVVTNGRRFLFLRFC